jgi:hypothetical protein
MRYVLCMSGLPMAGAAFGAWLDERRALGFTVWRAACRASGISLSSLATFTLELLPGAVIGTLLGGLVVLASGMIARPAAARGALAAHAGCVVAMPVGLLLCASALPWPLTLAAEFALTALAAAGMWWLARIRKATYTRAEPRGMSRIPRTAGALENFPVTHLWNSHDCK